LQGCCWLCWVKRGLIAKSAGIGAMGWSHRHRRGPLLAVTGQPAAGQAQAIQASCSQCCEA
jgi:hypothetical protein